MLTAAATLAGTPAAADPADDQARNDKQRIDQQLAQAAATYEAATKRTRDAARAYTEAASRLPDAQRRYALARGQSAAAGVAANRARRDADAARRVLGAATARYQETQRQVTAAKQQVGTFVAAANRGESAVAFTSLLTAGSPADFASRIAYLDQSAASLRESLRQVTIARHDARVAQNAATVAQQAADATRATAETQLSAARAAEQRAGDLASEVTGLIAAQQRALTVAQEEEAESERQYRQLQSESVRIAAVLRQLAARDRSPQRPAARAGGALFATPADGWKSSDFGRRFHPIAHRWRLHSGLDIAAPGGSRIVAADDGVVARAGWNGGYGKYTCIYHGRYQGVALSTCYAHQSSILVSRGQRVRRGQLIGRVGTTGSSTGYHLHFEVRRDGEPVNPRPYLPACLC